MSYYLDKGGNFIDTANFYTKGNSEIIVGKILEKKRDNVVLSTKFTYNLHPGNPNSGGNHRKCIQQSVNESLKRLNTDYIDIYYLHAWEFRTPIEEVLRTLDDLVTSGKVLYLGISDVPAWKVSEANTIAKFKGWIEFISLQVQYNLAERTVERDLVPMAMEFGIGILPWAPLFGGVLTGKYNPIDKTGNSNLLETKRKDINSWKLSDRNFEISTVVQEIAKKLNKTPAQVSINWLLQKPGVTCPIIGARTLNQVKDNIGSLDFKLDEDDIIMLDKISNFEMGFPYNFLNTESNYNRISGGTILAK